MSISPSPSPQTSSPLSDLHAVTTTLLSELSQNLLYHQLENRNLKISLQSLSSSLQSKRSYLSFLKSCTSRTDSQLHSELRDLQSSLESSLSQLSHLEDLLSSNIPPPWSRKKLHSAKAPAKRLLIN